MTPDTPLNGIAVVRTLRVLEALHGRALTRGELVARLVSHELRSADVVVALDALVDNRLVDRVLRERGAVYSTTPAGIQAMVDRGVPMRSGDQSLAVMFTDIVASTEIMSGLEENRAHLLRRDHFATLRKILGEHRGHEVKSMGDGLMAVFDKPDDAVACARAVQHAMRARQALRLRIGIDQGTPVREVDDYFGPVVVTARRLCDHAGPDDVLITETVVHALGPSGRRGVRLRGTQALKGLPTSIEIFEVDTRSPRPPRLPRPTATSRTTSGRTTTSTPEEHTP